MMKNKKSVFAGIPRTPKRDIARDALTENVEVLTGQRGENRALLLSDLINFDDMKRRALINSVNGSNTGGLPIVNPGAIERPHAPVSLSGTGGFTFIALTWDHPTYRGHAYAEIYRGDTDTFADSVKIASEVTDIFSDSVDMGSKYYYWVRFVNQVNMKGPTQGAAGVYVETQESAEMILDQIGGLIERSHLGAFLSEEISNSFDGLEQLAENLLEEAVSNDENADISRRNHVVVFEKQQTVLTEQSAIAQQQLLLSSEIDDLSANLTTNYLTQVDTNSAISQATIILKSNIEDEDGSSLGARLANDYRTKTETDSAISQATIALKANIEDENGSSIGALLVNSYLTQVETAGAISQATSLLKATIEDENGSSLGAILANDYRTQADTDETISQVTTTLRASIEDASGSSVGAALQTLSETVASNNNGVWALWGVKTTVAGLTSSIGLVNDGVDPIFAVKGAKFAIITSQDPNVLTPVFAVVNGKTVMKTALIDEAHIQSLVTDNLLSNRVIVGSQLTSPSINYNPTTGARSNNFSIDPNGNMQAKSAVLESVTIKDNLGNVVLSSTGAIASSQVTGLGSFATINSLGYSALTGKPTLGSLAAKNSITLSSVTDSGVFAGLDKILSTNVTTYIASGAIGTAQIDQAWISELFGVNASFLGRVYAESIEGDVTDLKVKKSVSVLTTTTSELTVISFTITRLPFARSVVISGIETKASRASGSTAPNISVKLYLSGHAAAQDSSLCMFGGETGTLTSRFLTVTIPANSTRTVTIKINKEGGGAISTAAARSQSVMCQTFKSGSTIS